MSRLVKNAAETNARARVDRYLSQGRVVTINQKAHTVAIDSNCVDAQGNPVYHEDIPFNPQTPPSPGDAQTLAYTNASPHSLYVAGGRLGGQNAQNTLSVVGGVSSVEAAGNPQLKGDVVFAAGTNCTLAQVGNQITINVSDIDPAAGITVEVDGAGGTAAPRTTLNFITGKGVAWTLVDDPGANEANITVDALFGTITPTDINVSNTPYSVPSGGFTIWGDTSGGAISVVLPAPAANDGRLIVVLRHGASALTVSSAAGAVVGITSLSDTQSVWYISDGINWRTFTNSVGN